MAGRKSIYKPEALEIGGKIELSGKAKKYRDQYLYTFKDRTGFDLVTVKEGSKVFIERIA
jgi:hypothetical protein